MLRKIGISESIKTTQFGGFCPYWTMVDGQVNVADTAEEIILSLPGDKRVIDPVAFLELLQFNYILGNGKRFLKRMVCNYFTMAITPLQDSSTVLISRQNSS